MVSTMEHRMLSPRMTVPTITTMTITTTILATGMARPPTTPGIRLISTSGGPGGTGAGPATTTGIRTGTVAAGMISAGDTGAMTDGVGGTVATGGADCPEGAQSTGARGADRPGGNQCVRTGMLLNTSIGAAGRRPRDLAGTGEQGTARTHRARHVVSRYDRIRVLVTGAPDLRRDITEPGRVRHRSANHRAPPADPAQDEPLPAGGDSGVD